MLCRKISFFFADLYSSDCKPKKKKKKKKKKLRLQSDSNLFSLCELNGI